ncbi:hypothetical protein GCM10027061_04090 [Nesterenkonia suensis]
MRTRRKARTTIPAAVCASGLMVMVPAAPALADDIQERNAWDEVEQGEWDAADASGHVERLDPGGHINRLDPDGHIRRLDPDGHIDTLDDTREEGGETIISLATDVLFDVNEWDVSEAAAERIGELIDDVPEEAEVSVTGHTDSRPPGDHVDFDNQELSENRAAAVAEVIEEVRPDLELEVSGVADEDPAVDEDEEAPETFAANRRVEIAFSTG